MRIDKYLAEKHGFSREYAKELIENGLVLINGTPPKKAGQEVAETDSVELLAGKRKYVSRGGMKLEAAINTFGISVKDRVCLDIGASTGGFTDCMLSFGAKYIYAVDVGSGQLAEKLRNDERVCCIENMNIKDFTPEMTSGQVSFITADLSFISLTKVMKTISGLLPENGEAVLLIKPQFEAGRGKVGKNGVVKNPAVHREVIENVRLSCEDCGMSSKDIIPSPIKGQEGNTEYLLHAVKDR